MLWLSPSLRLLELASENSPLRTVISRFRGWREPRRRRGVRIRSQSVLKLHALLPIWLYSRLSFAESVFSKDGDKHPTPEESAAITAVEADEYADVVGSSTPVHSDLESEGFTFRESVSYAFLKNLDGDLDTSGLTLFKFFINLIFTLLWLSLVDFT